MFKRRKTKTVRIGPVRLGSRYPVVIQSMTKVPTVETNRCAKQIRELVRAGCQLVRVAVPTRADTAAFAELVERAPVALIADVHFSPQRAIEAIEAGAAKVRLNPGNIKDRRALLRIIDAARAQSCAVRIGVNEASIRDLRRQDVPPSKRVNLMLREMRKYVRLFQSRNFDQLVLSAKSSSTLRTIQVNRRMAGLFDYPIHLGLTHAGLPEDAQIPSAVSLGTLLAEGIGDTIRISTAGNPVGEVEVAKKILAALGLSERSGPELIVCPGCGRAQIDITSLAVRVRKALRGLDSSLRVAVMGCVVNGPGEAADADLAICAAKNGAYIYRNGKRISRVPENKIIPEVLKLLKAL